MLGFYLMVGSSDDCLKNKKISYSEVDGCSDENSKFLDLEAERNRNFINACSHTSCDWKKSA